MSTKCSCLDFEFCEKLGSESHILLTYINEFIAILATFIVQVLDYQVFWIMKQYLCCPKFLQVMFYYSSWAAWLMRIFHLDISFSCWFSGFRVPLYISYQECWQTRRLLIRGLHRWKSCCSRLRRYNSQCRDALVGLLADLQMWDGFSQLLNCQDFWSIISFRIKEFCCIFIRSRKGLKN